MPRAPRPKIVIVLHQEMSSPGRVGHLLIERGFDLDGLSIGGDGFHGGRQESPRGRAVWEAGAHRREKEFHAPVQIRAAQRHSFAGAARLALADNRAALWIQWRCPSDGCNTRRRLKEEIGAGELDDPGRPNGESGVEHAVGKHGKRLDVVGQAVGANERTTLQCEAHCSGLAADGLTCGHGHVEAEASSAIAAGAMSDVIRKEKHGMIG